jgi:catechol 2,3-dioxygenase-like lactoylglutathione lyase family enzyme
MKLSRAAAIVALILFSSSLAQAAWRPTVRRPAKPPIATTRGAFFALSVVDLEASARWYSEKLGLEVVLNVPRTDGVAVRVLEGGGLIVELIQHDDAVPAQCAETDPVRCHGMFKVGVLVKDLDATLEKLAARGVPVAFGPFPAQANQRANAIIRDNAGNLIQIFER